MKVHVLILNYNGAGLLEKYLPSFIRAVQKSKHDSRVSVVDNCSEDPSFEAAKKASPSVGWIPMNKNNVLCSYNDAAKGLEDEILVFMNNDIEVPDDFLDPLIDPFLGDQSLFMTSPGYYSMDRKSLEGGQASGGVRWGLFWSKSSTGKSPDNRIVPTLSSGMGAVRRRMFVELGGYDPLYLPGTLEDVDLCFRAWKRGWKVLYVPQSRVFHEGQVSFKKKFGRRGIQRINFRNIYLFMWKNIHDPQYWFEHILFLLPRILWSLFKGQPELATGFLLALGRLPQALRARQNADLGLSDRQVFNMGTSS